VFFLKYFLKSDHGTPRLFTITNMDQKINLEELLLKYRDGNITVSELKLLYSFVHSKETPEQFSSIFQFLWENSQNDFVYNKYMGYNKLNHNILPLDSKNTRKHSKLRNNRIINSLSKYAAIVLFTLGLSWYYYNFIYTNEKLISYCKVQVAYGSRTKILLPDGTSVTLNSGSILRYPNVFKGGSRKVYLDGEAYFEVKKDTENPFIVNTGDLNIKVYGTTFNVKSYKNEPNVETTLLHGSVVVYKISENEKSNQIILAPNEQVIYDKNSRKLNKYKVDAELISIWKNGKYYFENETFAEIASKLERNFNLKVAITDEDLKKVKFSGLFDKSRSINQVLDAMKHYCRFSYSIINDSIIIQKKH